MKKVFYIILISFVSIIIIGEVLLRICFYEQLKHQIEPNIFQADTIIGYTMIPNSEAIQSLPSIKTKIKINNQGFNGNDFETTKKPRILRIAVVGASNFDGLYVDPLQNSIYLLQQKFINNGYSDVEIINCALQGGHRGMQQLSLIRQKIMHFKPDAILLNIRFDFWDLYISREDYKGFVIEYATGSIESRKKSRKVVDTLYKNKLFTSIYDISFIVRAGVKKYLENFVKNRPVTLFQRCVHSYRNNKVHCTVVHSLNTHYSYRRSIDELEKLSEEIEEQGTLLVIFSLKRAMDIELLQTSSLKYFFISLNHDGVHSISYKHDGHLNEIGHEIVAEQLYQTLIKSNLILNRKTKYHE